MCKQQFHVAAGQGGAAVIWTALLLYGLFIFSITMRRVLYLFL